MTTLKVLLSHFLGAFHVVIEHLKIDITQKNAEVSESLSLLKISRSSQLTQFCNLDENIIWRSTGIEYCQPILTRASPHLTISFQTVNSIIPSPVLCSRSSRRDQDDISSSIVSLSKSWWPFWWKVLWGSTQYWYIFWSLWVDLSFSCVCISWFKV